MTFRSYMAMAAALLLSAAVFAASDMSKISYLQYRCLEGIELTHYVFMLDEKATPWLVQVVDNNIETSPRKKATKDFVRSLQELVEQGDVFSYEREYYAEPEVCGGAKWELEVRLQDGQAVYSSGRAVYPPKSIIEELGLLCKSFLYQRP